MSPSNAVECYPCRKVPLNYNRSLLFHGGDTGSTPVRDANPLRVLHKKKFKNSQMLDINHRGVPHDNGSLGRGAIVPDAIEKVLKQREIVPDKGD